MYLLKNADASLKDKRKQAKDHPAFVDFGSIVLLQGQINEEEEYNNNTQFRNTEFLTEENSRQCGNDH